MLEMIWMLQPTTQPRLVSSWTNQCLMSPSHMTSMIGGRQCKGGTLMRHTLLSTRQSSSNKHQLAQIEALLYLQSPRAHNLHLVKRRASWGIRLREASFRWSIETMVFTGNRMISSVYNWSCKSRLMIYIARQRTLDIRTKLHLMIFSERLSKYHKQRYSNQEQLTHHLIIGNSGPKWCNQKLVDDH